MELLLSEPRAITIQMRPVACYYIPHLLLLTPAATVFGIAIALVLAVRGRIESRTRADRWL